MNEIALRKPVLTKSWIICHRVQPGLADSMVQVQLLIPSVKTDATVTANMRRTGGIALEIKSDVKLPETSSIQAVTFLFSMSAREKECVNRQQNVVCPALKRDATCFEFQVTTKSRFS